MYVRHRGKASAAAVRLAAEAGEKEQEANGGGFAGLGGGGKSSGLGFLRTKASPVDPDAPMRVDGVTMEQTQNISCANSYAERARIEFKVLPNVHYLPERELGAGTEPGPMEIAEMYIIVRKVGDGEADAMEEEEEEEQLSPGGTPSAAQYAQTAGLEISQFVLRFRGF